MLLKDIKAILGGDISSKNSKMPGTSFGLSTDYCPRGSKLRDVEGSVCHGCYAKRLEDFRPCVKKGWTSRTEAILKATASKDGHNSWVEAMVERLDKLNPEHHRWHDSGDILNPKHLNMLVDVALRLPHIKFWLPTRERAMVSSYLKSYALFPKNLVVRVSADMVDQRETRFEHNSMVVKNLGSKTLLTIRAWVCPARHQGNACQDCRACWDSEVATVAYPKH